MILIQKKSSFEQSTTPWDTKELSCFVIHIVHVFETVNDGHVQELINGKSILSLLWGYILRQKEAISVIKW